MEKNADRALHWLLKAANQRDDDAQRFLGKCYAEGNGVTMDLVEACKWFVLAKPNQDEAKDELNALRDRYSLNPEQVAEVQHRVLEFQLKKAKSTGKVAFKAENRIEISHRLSGKE